MLAGLMLLVAAATGAQPVAIVDVTVIPMNRETALAHQTVVVQGERIVSVGSAGSTRVPDDAVIIDGSGRYLVGCRKSADSNPIEESHLAPTPGSLTGCHLRCTSWCLRSLAG